MSAGMRARRQEGESGNGEVQGKGAQRAGERRNRQQRRFDMAGRREGQGRESCQRCTRKGIPITRVRLTRLAAHARSMA